MQIDIWGKRFLAVGIAHAKALRLGTPSLYQEQQGGQKGWKGVRGEI